MKKILIRVVIVIVLALLAAWGVFEALDWKMEHKIETAYKEIDAVDLSKVPDGVYPGRFGDFLVDVALEVRVKDGTIAEIVIKEQKCGKGYEGLETVERILAGQTAKVDVVAGATWSSKCIMIATHQAILKK